MAVVPDFRGYTLFCFVSSMIILPQMMKEHFRQSHSEIECVQCMLYTDGGYFLFLLGGHQDS